MSDSTNPNRCETCNYKQIDKEHNDSVEAHCYMFKFEPPVCGQYRYYIDSKLSIDNLTE